MDQKIFICYSRADGKFAVRLDHDLDLAGFDSFLDQNDIPPGARWDEFVEKALKESTTVVVILSPASVSSENVLDEVGYALREGKRVIPVRHEVCQVPMRIDRLHYIDFTTGYDAGLAELVSALKADAARRPRRPLVSTLPAPVAPTVNVRPGRSKVLLPAVLTVVVLLAGAAWALLSLSGKDAANTTTSPTTTETTNTTNTTSTTTTAANQTETGDTAATATTATFDTSHLTTTLKPVITTTRPHDPPKQPRFQCAEETLDVCCRDSANPAACRKCKQQLDIPDRCE